MSLHKLLPNYNHGKWNIRLIIACFRVITNINVRELLALHFACGFGEEKEKEQVISNMKLMIFKHH